jgi:hypothetical protein
MFPPFHNEIQLITHHQTSPLSYLFQVTKAYDLEKKKTFKTQEIPGVRLGLIQEDSQVIGRTPSHPLLPVAHLGRPSVSDLKSTAP